MCIKNKVNRSTSCDFGLGYRWDKKGYQATVDVFVREGNALTGDRRVRTSTYFGYGDSPESALAALKEAVKEGEEGWTW